MATEGVKGIWTGGVTMEGSRSGGTCSTGRPFRRLLLGRGPRFPAGALWWVCSLEGEVVLRIVGT